MNPPHSESTDGILNCGRNSKFNDHLMSIKESKYKRSPLGSTVNRQYHYPIGLGTDTPFGVTLTPENNDDLLTHNIDPCDESVTKRCAMDWESVGINIKVHTFGSTPKKQFIDGEIANVQQALIHAIPQEDNTNAHLVHYRQLHHEPLGQSKPLIPRIHVDKELVFGVKSTKESNGVAKILQHVDQDNTPVFEAKRDGDLKEIAFKIPMKESGADELINPSSFTEQGLDSAEYKKIRSKDEIRDLIAKAQINIDSVNFDRVFEIAKGKESTGCSISAFLNTRMQILLNSSHNTNS